MMTQQTSRVNHVIAALDLENTNTVDAMGSLLRVVASLYVGLTANTPELQDAIHRALDVEIATQQQHHVGGIN